MTIERISTFILFTTILLLAVVFFNQQYDGQLLEWLRSLFIYFITMSKTSYLLSINMRMGIGLG